MTMTKTGLPLYEGDGLIRSANLDPVALDTIERDARALRAAHIGGLIERGLEWLEHVVWRARQKDVAEFLSGAKDHADLEQRMKSLQHPTRFA